MLKKCELDDGLIRGLYITVASLKHIVGKHNYKKPHNRNTTIMELKASEATGRAHIGAHRHVSSLLHECDSAESSGGIISSIALPGPSLPAASDVLTITLWVPAHLQGSSEITQAAAAGRCRTRPRQNKMSFIYNYQRNRDEALQLQAPQFYNAEQGHGSAPQMWPVRRLDPTSLLTAKIFFNSFIRAQQLCRRSNGSTKERREL
ncbi:unnamed protein product [Pleuronectes platessa]|uniref:Uncharacterized protein n=1 Tax=Pleuronectes platessa TaxID=8262 RepID=A0A9N7YEH4_PLEPL|nr:unnamed protein product [Pleuronectes platessa]